MVKSKGGRSMNPADAHRKAQRKKELKKNKVERKKVREVAMAVKDTTKLEAEITKYEELGKEKRLDKNGYAKLIQLKEQLEKIIKTKEAHKIPLIKAAPKQPPKLVNPDDPESSPYYHPTLNPLGLAPSQARQAGYQIPHAQKDEENDEDESDESMDSNASGGEQDDNNHGEDEELPELPPGSPPTKPAEMATVSDEEEDDELPELPPGTPPRKEGESQDDDDDMIELPPGPPPARLLEQGSFPLPLPPAGYAQYSGVPPPPPMRPGYYPPPGMLGGPPPFARLDMRGPPGVPQSFASRPPPPPPRPSQYYAPYQSPRPPSGPHPRPPYAHYGPPGGRPYRPDYPNPDGVYAPLPPSAPPAPGVSAELAPTITLPPRPQLAPAPVISAAPQVRDLRKELTTLVPASVLRKKFAAEKVGTGKVARPKINAAPDLDTETDERGTNAATTLVPAVSVPGPVVQGVKATVPGPTVPGPTVPVAVAGAAKGNRERTTDEYAKFMKEMEGLL